MPWNELKIAARRVFSQPAFIAVFAILLICAVGMSGSIQYLQLNFKKMPVPLAHSLSELPPDMGPWKQVSIDSALPEDIAHSLATDDYIFRDYVDTRIISRDEIEQFRGKTPAECRQLISNLQAHHPEAVVNLGLTYYTGLVDTVAHIPERCYTADGYEPTVHDDVAWKCLADRPGAHLIRFLTFEDAMSRQSSLRRNVAYVFHCDGEYINDSIAVRKRLANLFERYGYYMKVEVQCLSLPPERASVVLNDFLTNALPSAERALPDWSQYHAAR